MADDLIGDLVNLLMQAWQRGKSEPEIRREFRSLIETALPDLEGQQLAQARALLEEELPYEDRTSGYHAEEWSARVRAFLGQHKE